MDMTKYEESALKWAKRQRILYRALGKAGFSREQAVTLVAAYITGRKHS